ncbi:Protein of uncharacterised function (DUF551) [Yersinia rohdei]|uniref:Protein of uncharacterized function (DUF551) n=1 Tax=Yersinia rohdei TaxID=29485 RepID=A0A0U1HQS5_YERRO|nr:DUF551 domain-containing protein [Yersinia rohdei]CQI88931.1 Protein of uncharacterised function (DUF551) [Yersinia rohdei]
MSDLDNFTVERLEDFILQPLENGLTRGEQMSLARIALSAKQAEPVDELAYDAGREIMKIINETHIGGQSQLQAKIQCRIEELLSVTPPANSLVVPEGWIKCSDRMPESSTDVSLFHPEIGVFNGYCWRGLFRDKKPEFFSNSGEHEDGLKPGVTHGMPLPAAPEKPL